MAWAGAGVVGVEVGVELEGACLVGMSSSRSRRPLLLKKEETNSSPDGGFHAGGLP